MSDGTRNEHGKATGESAPKDPAALYDGQAGRWVRRQKSSLSDFTARPVVFEMCGDVSGLDVLDLGCGEGYCSRELKRRGARSLIGIELSEEMLAAARHAEASDQLGIEYRQGDIRNIDLPDESVDLATAVFVFNYLTIAEMETALREMRRVLRVGGAAVFSVPHPAFPFMRAPEPPFFFDFEGRDYFSARDVRNSGQIQRLDGTPLDVQMVHKTFEDTFAALAGAGWTTLPELRELRVLQADLEAHGDFMGPLVGLPLHVAIRIVR